MIGQQIGLDYLVPLAIETLENDLFAEGNYYEGDLLKSVLSIRTDFWQNNNQHWKTVNELIKNKRQQIAGKKFDTRNFDGVTQ
jgi:hypothetical protein